MLGMMMAERDSFWQEKLNALQQRVTVLEEQVQNRKRDGSAQHGVAGNQATSQEEMAKLVPGANPDGCYICGGTKSVHQHRDLAVKMDDKCRKQYDTVKTGGKLTLRREGWIAALHNICSESTNKFAREMLHKIGEANDVGADRPQQPHKKKRKIDQYENVEKENQATAAQCTKENDDQCSQCTICQDHLHAHNSSKQIELPCRHKFHENCIIPWLKSKKNPAQQACPNCRTNVRLEYPNGKNGDVKVVLGAPHAVECSPCGDNADECQRNVTSCVATSVIQGCSESVSMDEDVACCNQNFQEDVWEELPDDFIFNESDLALLNDAVMDDEETRLQENQDRGDYNPLGLDGSNAIGENTFMSSVHKASNAGFGSLDGMSFGG